jgi:formylmethanofuran--tetrahydromethanopterin N-formyltransferase
MSEKDLARQLQLRVGQCVLTCAGTACFAGLAGETKAPLGNALRFFGDGYQTSKRLGGRRFWRIPVMDGEFLIEDAAGTTGGVGGGNFLILAASGEAARAAAEAAVEAMRILPNIVLPFPGGIVRSGSKVGSKYKGLIASTNDAFCPTIRAQSPRSVLPPEVEAVLEIVIDGLSEADVAAATAAGVRAACALGRDAGVVAISAGNYGGKLGPYHFHLHRVLS